jgi:methionine-rich copper-binding protein CopC
MPYVCRVLVLLWLATLSLVGTVAPASAHTGLVWSYPAAGMSLPNPPAEVALEVDDPLQLEVSQLVVRDALGEVQPLDGPRLTRGGLVLTGALAGGGAWGQWQVDYRLVGTDGHAVTGRIDFAVGEPAIVADDDSSSLLWWLIAAGILLPLGAAWYLRWSTGRALRRPAGEPDAESGSESGSEPVAEQVGEPVETA